MNRAAYTGGSGFRRTCWSVLIFATVALLASGFSANLSRANAENGSARREAAEREPTRIAAPVIERDGIRLQMQSLTYSSEWDVSTSGATIDRTIKIALGVSVPKSEPAYRFAPRVEWLEVRGDDGIDLLRYVDDSLETAHPGTPTLEDASWNLDRRQPPRMAIESTLKHLPESVSSIEVLRGRMTFVRPVATKSIRVPVDLATDTSTHEIDGYSISVVRDDSEFPPNRVLNISIRSDELTSETRMQDAAPRIAAVRVVHSQKERSQFARAVPHIAWSPEGMHVALWMMFGGSTRGADADAAGRDFQGIVDIEIVTEAEFELLEFEMRDLPL